MTAQTILIAKTNFFPCRVEFNSHSTDRNCVLYSLHLSILKVAFSVGLQDGQLYISVTTVCQPAKERGSLKCCLSIVLFHFKDSECPESDALDESFWDCWTCRMYLGWFLHHCWTCSLLDSFSVHFGTNDLHWGVKR